MDKEEDFIIKSRVLEDSITGSMNPERTRELRKAFADLHGMALSRIEAYMQSEGACVVFKVSLAQLAGSMILLLHWSLLNFTAGKVTGIRDGSNPFTQ